MAVESAVSVPVGIRCDFRNGVNVAAFDVTSDGIGVGVVECVLSFLAVPGSTLAIVDADDTGEFVQIPYLQQAEIRFQYQSQKV